MLCPHTAKTHFYANKDIWHTMSPLKLNIIILIQVMKDLEKV